MAGRIPTHEVPRPSTGLGGVEAATHRLPGDGREAASPPSTGAGREAASPLYTGPGREAAGPAYTRPGSRGSDPTAYGPGARGSKPPTVQQVLGARPSPRLQRLKGAAHLVIGSTSLSRGNACRRNSWPVRSICQTTVNSLRQHATSAVLFGRLPESRV